MMTHDPDTVERMASVHWNLTANIPWKDIPDAWREPERKRMAAAIQAQRSHEEREAMR